MLRTIFVVKKRYKDVFWSHSFYFKPTFNSIQTQKVQNTEKNNDVSLNLIQLVVPGAKSSTYNLKPG